MPRIIQSFIILSCLSVLTACTLQTKTQKGGTYGAAGGAVAGAVIGQVIGGDTEATLIGAAIGAAAGAGAGALKDKEDKKKAEQATANYQTEYQHCMNSKGN